MVMITLYAKQKKRHRYTEDFGTLWEKARVGCLEITALKQVNYQGWNRSPAQVGCLRQVLRAGALGRPRGMGWRGRWERWSGWGIHVNPWLIHVNVWQKPLQYCKVISLQLIKINEKKSGMMHKEQLLNSDRTPQTSEKTRKPPHNWLEQKENEKELGWGLKTKEGVMKEGIFPHTGKSLHQ